MPCLHLHSGLRRRLGLVLLGLVLGLLAAGTREAWAGPVLDRVLRDKSLRVCIWADYYGITYLNARTGRFSGLDTEMAEQLAADLGVGLHYVDSSFPRLIGDLDADLCDIAMFAVARTPQRMERLQFSEPYMQGGIYAITRRDSPVKVWQDIDRTGVRAGVPAGTFVEMAMAGQLAQARPVVVGPPTTQERELQAGRLDVFFTDYPYSRRLLAREDWAVLLSPPAPLAVQLYAYAMKLGDTAWRDRVNTFVAAVKRDGRLRQAARQQGLEGILVP